MSFFDNAETVTLAGKVVTKLELAGKTIYEKVLQKYKNWVSFSIDTDGSIFNGKGWIGKTRLSSSGATKSADYVSTTGYIPAKANDAIRIAGLNWLNSENQSGNYVCTYDANFAFIAAVNCVGSYGGGTVSGDSEVAIVTLKSTSTIAYVRVSGMGAVVDGPGDSLIVTVNEEIT